MHNKFHDNCIRLKLKNESKEGETHIKYNVKQNHSYAEMS